MPYPTEPLQTYEWAKEVRLKLVGWVKPTFWQCWGWVSLRYTHATN